MIVQKIYMYSFIYMTGVTQKFGSEFLPDSYGPAIYVNGHIGVYK